MKTQKETVLEYLLAGKTINARKAIAYFNIIRLSAIIFFLKQDGWKFETEYKPNELFNGVYAEYKIKL